jgi:N-hydroxyarylamine O-acetyltransferase
VAAEGGERVLQRRHQDRWEDLYVFAPEARHPVDFEVGNWYTSTHPRSPFVTAAVAQRATPEARHSLRNLTYATRRGQVVESRTIDRGELLPLLDRVFGIELPAGARLKALDESLQAT